VIIGLLIFMAIYLLLVVAFHLGKWCGKEDFKIEGMLIRFDEYRKLRDEEYPDMIGKWGKP
jgi:hypothetical protein